MKEVSHTEEFMGEEQLQDISGGCNGCLLLRQASDGFRTSTIRNYNRSERMYLSGLHTEAQKASINAKNDARHVRTINNALAQIKHVE